MKILFITQYFYPEPFRVNTLAAELVKRGHNVTVLTGFPQYPYGEIYDGYGFKKPYEKVWNGVNVIRLNVTPRGHNTIGMLRNCISYVLKANGWVRKCKEKYDVIYVFEVSPVTVGLPAVKYKKKFGIPVLFNVQDLWPENVIEVLGINNRLVIGVINKIVNKIYKNSDRILCSSTGFVKNIMNRGEDERKLVFWPQFCESPDFDRMLKPACYDEKYFNIVFTGNIGYAQGLDLLVTSAERLRDKPVRWYIVGDGRAKDELMKKVELSNLKDSVFFIGRVPEKEANSYVRFSDCAYLSFSDSRLFDLTIPAKLQTYLACGAPVLGAVGGESADIIRRAECGVVCDKTPDSVVTKLTEIMALSSSERDTFRENAMEYYNSNFNMYKVIDDLEAIIYDVAGK